MLKSHFELAFHRVVALVAKSGLSLVYPNGLLPIRLICPWDFPGKNTGVGCHFLLQGIFPTKGWNNYLLHWQAVSLPQSQQRGPILLSTKVYFNGEETWGSGCVLHHAFHFWAPCQYHITLKRNEAFSYKITSIFMEQDRGVKAKENVVMA